MTLLQRSAAKLGRVELSSEGERSATVISKPNKAPNTTAMAGRSVHPLMQMQNQRRAVSVLTFCWGMKGVAMHGRWEVEEAYELRRVLPCCRTKCVRILRYLSAKQVDRFESRHGGV